MPTLKVQNLYNTTVTEASGIPATGDCNFTVWTPPTYSNGFIVISPDNSSLREIMYYHDMIGSRIYVRWENRFSPKAHSSSETVKMNDVAEIFNTFSDMISQAFYVEKTGWLNVRIWWGYVYYNGSPISVPDTNLILANNTTNYIKYDYPTNTFSVDTVNSWNIKAQVITSSWAISSITYRTAKESYIDFTVALTGALPSQTGNAGKSLMTDGVNVSWWINNNLRSNLLTAQNITATNGSPNITVTNTDGWFNGATITGTGIPNGTTILSFVANTSAVLSANFTGTTGSVAVTVWIRQLTELDTFGNEVKRPISSASTLIASDLFQIVDPTTRARREVSYETMQTDPQYIAWESLAQGDAIGIEYFGDMCEGFWWLPVGNITAQSRVYQQIIGSGVSMTTLTTPAVKSGSPVDNYILTIETDSSGVPSGTLADANATATLASSGFSASWTDKVWTFAWAFTLALGTKYHIVIKRSGGIDASNFIHFTQKTRNTRVLWSGFYTGASYASATFTNILSCSGTGILKQFVSKASASSIETANVIGFAKSAYTPGQSVLVANTLTTTWLTDQKYYYLSNTAWAISLTPGTIKCVVWFSKGTASLIYDKTIYNPFSQDSVLLQFHTFSVTNTAIPKEYIFKDYGKLQINISWTWPRMIIRVDGTLLIDTTSSYTLQFEPNKIYSIVFAWWQGVPGTTTYNLSRTYPFNHANLIY